MALVRAAESEQDAAIYLTAAFTGLRQGELLALRWRDVDFELELVRVRSNFTHGREGSPKSGRERAVPMMVEVAQALARLSQRERFSGDRRISSSAASSAATSARSTSPRATARRSSGPSSAAALPRPPTHVRYARDPRCGPT